MENGQIVKTYAANGGTVYRSDLTFDPSRLTPEGPALAAAQSYATRHNISYDSVRALLKQTSLDRPFRWRIELMNDGRSRGYVFINALDSSVASYVPAGSSPRWRRAAAAQPPRQRRAVPIRTTTITAAASATT